MLKRTKTTHDEYLKRLQKIKRDKYSFTNEEVIWEDTFEKLVVNSFPYDNIAKDHHLLIDKVGQSWNGFVYNLDEFIARFGQYDTLMINMKAKSIGTKHIHLINWKNE